MSIELKPYRHEAQVALADDFTLQMVMDFAAIDLLERMLGKGIDKIIDSMSSFATMTKVLWAVTREHHAEISLDQVTGILLSDDPAKQKIAKAVIATLGDLVHRSVPLEIEPKKKAPRKPHRG